MKIHTSLLCVFASVWLMFTLVKSEEGLTYSPDVEVGVIAVNDTDNVTISDVTLSPTIGDLPFLLMFMTFKKELEVNFTITCYTPETSYNINVSTSDGNVLFLTKPGNFSLSCANSTENETLHPYKNATLYTGSFTVSLEADLLGRAWLFFNESIDDSDSNHSPNNTDGMVSKVVNQIVHQQLVVVMRPLRVLDHVIQAIVYIFIISTTIGMGCKTDLTVVKECLKKPIAPVIGFVSQYAAMPLIAFGVAKLVPFENPAMALGIFACGTCPGGGMSNIYSYLLGGDLSLSVTMTTISTIAALGMVPLWLFTLGQQFKDDKIQINIPYTSIVRTLATIILPLIAGIIIQYKFKRVAKIIMKVIKPVTLVAVAVLLSVGIYGNLYIFRLFNPMTILAGCMLPYVGYIVGGVLALICRQPWTRVKTIAIETGVQNVLVAYLILLLGLPPPDGDLAAVGPAASACMTPLPLFVLSIIYNIYLKCTRKNYQGVSTRPGTHETEVGTDQNENETKKKKKSKSKDDVKEKDEDQVEMIDRMTSV